MSTFLIFLAGTLCLALVLFLVPRVKQQPKTWQKVLIWVLFGVFFIVAMIGISFVYINAGVGHTKATSTAIFLFGGISVVLAVILARLLGFLGGKAVNAPKTEQMEGR